jgi:hypothetical protein
MNNLPTIGGNPRGPLGAGPDPEAVKANNLLTLASIATSAAECHKNAEDKQSAQRAWKKAALLYDRALSLLEPKIED